MIDSDSVDSADSADQAALLALLSARGSVTSSELQAALGRSQPTVSRLLAAAMPAPLVLGSGRRTRYALPRPIVGAAAQHTLHWVHESGHIEAWGQLSFLHGNQVHVRAQGVDLLTRGHLPWFMAPLRGEGFLGQLQARRLAVHGLGDNPERWPLEHVLFAALQTTDAPGALVLGEPQPVVHTSANHDQLADMLASSLPAGSSAGGEQAKFLTHRADGQPLLVKFSPPRGSPFGIRWHALLHLEALALAVLAEHGVPVAAARVVETARRTYLESVRFDRIGRSGRRHVVPLHAVHEAFVTGPRQHWADTCDALVRQRRLPAEAAAQVRAVMQFGRLIGNTDMHFGNLSLFVAPGDVAAGRFALAPVYDMLPMRWRPDPHADGFDLLPFEPMPLDLQSPARPVALVFWQGAAEHPALDAAFRELAATMAQRLGSA
jgi:HipA-like C-terminal domain